MIWLCKTKLYNSILIFVMKKMKSTLIKQLLIFKLKTFLIVLGESLKKFLMRKILKSNK